MKNLARDLGRLEVSSRTAEFGLLGKILLENHGDLIQANAKHASLETTPSRIKEILKAAVTVGALDDPSVSSLAGYRQIAEGFAESLSSVGVFDAVLQSARRVPLRSRLGIITAGAVGGLAGRSAKAKPISKLALSSGSLEDLTAVALVIVTGDVVRFGVASDLLTRELQTAVTRTCDGAFITALKMFGTPAVPVGDPMADVGALLEAVNTGDRSALFLIMSSLNAKRAAVAPSVAASNNSNMRPQGGVIAGVRALVSDEMLDDEIVLVDAAQVAADGGQITLSTARSATLEMESDPSSEGFDGESPPGTTGPTGDVLSLWQTNSLGLRAERIFGFELLASTGAAVAAGVDWSAAESPE